jgi:hypothetical protein
MKRPDAFAGDAACNSEAHAEQAFMSRGNSGAGPLPPLYNSHLHRE